MAYNDNWGNGPDNTFGDRWRNNNPGAAHAGPGADYGGSYPYGNNFVGAANPYWSNRWGYYGEPWYGRGSNWYANWNTNYYNEPRFQRWNGYYGPGEWTGYYGPGEWNGYYGSGYAPGNWNAGGYGTNYYAGGWGGPYGVGNWGAGYGTGYTGNGNTGYGPNYWNWNEYNAGMNQGRQGTYSGRGPRSYQRSDTRIEEDVNDRLTAHPGIDASEVNVSVRNGEVTLTGTVDSRSQKRIAEDVAESVPGVTDVHNQLRTASRGQMNGTHEHEAEGDHGRRAPRQRTGSAA